MIDKLDFTCLAGKVQLSFIALTNPSDNLCRYFCISLDVTFFFEEIFI